MALATTFKARMENYVGVTDDDASLTQFLRFSAAEVIELLPSKIALRYSTATAVANADGHATGDQKMLALNRNGYEAKEVSLGMKAAVEDSGSIHLASARTPVFYVSAGTVFIKPDPTSLEPGNIFSITYPDLAYDTTSLSIGPEFVNEAIVMSASIKYLLKRLQDHASEIPVVLGAITDFAHAATMPSLSDATYSGLATVTYDSTGTATTLEAVSDADFSAVNLTGLTAPEYTAPSNDSAFGSITTQNTFDYNLQVEEDIEKASVELQKQGQLLGDYQADIQNAVALFNDTVTEYQTASSKAVQDAQSTNSLSMQNMQKDLAISQANAQIAESRALSNKIQETQEIIQNNSYLFGLFQQNLGRYQANFNKEFQIYTQNISKDLQVRAVNVDRVMKNVGILGQQLSGLSSLYQQEVAKIKALT